MATAPMELAPGLYLIAGHHPVSMWEDVNVPNILVMHENDTLYLLDSGLGAEQKRAVLDLVGQLRGKFSRVMLLNSHGHADHTGNNDVLAEIQADEKLHYISELSKQFFDPLGFFRDAYDEGADYFDYLRGLDLSVEGLWPLLTRAGLDPGVDKDALADIGRRVDKLGLTPVISHYWGDLMMRNVSETYPPLHPSVETMRWYETQPKVTFEYGEAQWTGWQLGEVCVFEGHGHTADGVLFYLPQHKFLFFGDETTTIPIWKDTNTDNTARNLRNAQAMVDVGAVESIAAGHFPMQVITGAGAVGETLTAFLDQKNRFDREVTDAVKKTAAGGVSIDDLYESLRTNPEGVVAGLVANQFPKMPSFVKLTLLNFCRQHFTQAADDAGRPVFRNVK